MSTRLWKHRLATALVASICPFAAQALPPEASVSDNDDDATITLFVDSQTIPDDSRSRCRVRFEDAGSDVEYSDGDSVEIWIYEDDALGDDVIWSTAFDVNRADLVGGALTREFDCSAAFGADGVGTLEIYAEAHVTKDECGIVCLDDTPTTSNISLEEVEDDGNEEDDGLAAAHGLILGRNLDRICRDQDWQSVDLQSRSRVILRADHRAEAGRLDITLLDGAGNQVPGSDTVDAAGSTTLTFEPLDVGTWHFRVSPREGNDYNFYDLNFAVETLAGDCNPGDMESQACGNCGTQNRECDRNGNWLPYDPCENEGECAPLDSRVSDCGDCGTTTDTCDDTCHWTAGSCENEGICAPGADDEQDCPEGGTQVRVCGEDCNWGQYGECGGAECMNDESRECYTGDEGTISVGVCRPGVERCVAGRWAPCEGQVVPSIEACEDGQDNDCDGNVDGADNNCGGAPQIGDPCENDAQCAAGQVCLQAPAHPQFPDGYCGVVPCQEDCGDGAACVSAFGRQYCLRNCAEDRDCRAGYRCLEVQPGDRVCAPPCGDDSDCGDARRPTCDSASGLCIASSGPGPGADMGGSPSTSPPTAPPTGGPGTLPPPDGQGFDMGVFGVGGLDAGEADGGSSGGGSKGNSSGCQLNVGAGSLPFWGLLALPLLILRRRRATR